METQWTRMTADEAAEIIQHNDMVAFSGFTPAGSPKALPTAIARRANEQHEAKTVSNSPADGGVNQRRR